MKRLLLCFVLFGFPAGNLLSAPLINNATLVSPEKSIPDEVLLRKIESLKIKDLEKITGRKFSLKEKIAYLVMKKKLKHYQAENQSQGQTAFTFGIIALALLVLGLFVPYVILGSLVASILAIVLGSVAWKKDPSDRKAQAGKLLGVITLGVIAFLFLLAAIVLASWF